MTLKMSQKLVKVFVLTAEDLDKALERFYKEGRGVEKALEYSIKMEGIPKKVNVEGPPHDNEQFSIAGQIETEALPISSNREKPPKGNGSFPTVRYDPPTTVLKTSMETKGISTISNLKGPPYSNMWF